MFVCLLFFFFIVSPCAIGKPEGPCQVDIQQEVGKASVNEQSSPCISFLKEVLAHCSYRNMSHFYSKKNCEQICGRFPCIILTDNTCCTMVMPV